LGKRVVICLPEDIPWENKGEAALFFGIVESLKIFPDFLFISLTDEDEDVANYKCDRCEVIKSSIMSKKISMNLFWAVFLLISSLLGRLKFYRPLINKLSMEGLSSLLKADIIMLGHDNVFNYTGPRSLLLQLMIVLLAKTNRKKLVAYGASIGPLAADKRYRNRIRLLLEPIILSVVKPFFRAGVLQQLNLITCREQHSVDFLNDFNVHKPRIHLTADLAFLINPKEGEVDRYVEDHSFLQDSPLVGITPNDVVIKFLMGPEGNPFNSSREQYNYFCSMMAELCDFIISELCARVVMLPHGTGPSARDDDRTLIMNIYNKVKQQHGISLINDDLSAHLIKGIIGRLDLLIGSRTHSLIGATSLSVPVVGLSASNRFKTNGIIGDQMGQDDFIFFLDEMEKKELFNMVGMAWSNREVIRSTLKSRAETVIQKAVLNGQLLRDLAGH